MDQKHLKSGNTAYALLDTLGYFEVPCHEQKSKYATLPTLPAPPNFFDDYFDLRHPCP